MDWIEAGVPREEILEDYPNLTSADLDAAVEFDRTMGETTPI
jgi:uncharacterized protein (DUF433 family)